MLKSIEDHTGILILLAFFAGLVSGILSKSGSSTHKPERNKCTLNAKQRAGFEKILQASKDTAFTNVSIDGLAIEVFRIGEQRVALIKEGDSDCSFILRKNERSGVALKGKLEEFSPN